MEVKQLSFKWHKLFQLIHKHTHHNKTQPLSYIGKYLSTKLDLNNVLRKTKGKKRRNIHTSLETELNTRFAVDKPNEEQKVKMQY